MIAHSKAPQRLQLVTAPAEVFDPAAIIDGDMVTLPDLYVPTTGKSFPLAD